jgi:iron complex outermembrane receptor protein
MSSDAVNLKTIVALSVLLPAFTVAAELDTARRSNTQIEEVVVTAQKRAENVQDVPISMQAFSASTVEDRGLSDPIKLQVATPGLVYDELAGFSIIFLRGIGTDAFIPSADMSVATYIDGVYFPFSRNAARSFGAIERIEVLKGPQGTLFGRNSTGGAISITTKRPSFEEWMFKVQAGAADYNERNIGLFASGPITDEFAISANVFRNTKDEYYELSETSPLDSLDSYLEEGATIKLAWTPNESFDFVLTGYSLDSEGPGTNLFVQLKPSSLGTALGARAEESDYETSVNEPPQSFTDTQAVYLNASYFPGPFDVKYIGAYEHNGGTSLADFDGSSANIVGFGTRGKKDPLGPVNFTYVRTHELQFTSNESTPFSDKLRWAMGLYYLESQAGFDPVGLRVAGLDMGVNGLLSDPSTLPGLGGGVDFSVIEGPLNTLSSFTSELPVGAYFTTSGRLGTEAYAAYTQFTYDITDWMAFTGGLRYQEEKRNVYKSRVSTVTGEDSGNPQQQTLNEFPDDAIEGSNLSPKAVLDFKISDDILLFASWSKGFKSGSFNIISITEPPGAILPEEVENYEIGLKSDWLDRRLRINGAIFQTKIQDLQVQYLSLLSGGVTTFENAGQATVRGAELSTVIVPFADVLIELASTYLEGTYDSYINGSGYDENGVYSSDNDFSGNTIVRNPKLTTSLSFNWNPEVPGGYVGLGADVYANSGYYFDAQNSNEQESYTQFNVRMSYLYEDWNLKITVYGDNITSQKRYLFKFPNDFGVVGKLAPPAVYGLRLSYDY